MDTAANDRFVFYVISALCPMKIGLQLSLTANPEKIHLTSKDKEICCPDFEIISFGVSASEKSILKFKD